MSCTSHGAKTTDQRVGDTVFHCCAECDVIICATPAPKAPAPAK